MTTTTLSSLLERTAAGDGAAFRVLHDALCGAVRVRAARTLARDRDVDAVVIATFVEVWWLARFHTSADVGVAAWVEDIATRRAGERGRLAGLDDLTRLDDDISRVALENLLVPR